MPPPVPTWLPFLTKQIALAGVLMATRSNLNFDSNFTATDDPTNDQTTISIASGTLTGVGDVTGPLNSANKVVTLTGSAGVVTLAAGTKITAGQANIGDLIAVSASAITFGNTTGAALSNVTVNSAGTLIVRSGVGTGYVNLVGGTASSGGFYFDANYQRFRDSGGTEYFRFDFTAPALLIDSLTGTFPASGLIRTKSYGSSTTLWGGRNAAGDANIIQQSSGGVLVFGDTSVTTGWGSQFNGFTVQINASQNPGGSAISLFARTAAAGTPSVIINEWGGTANFGFELGAAAGNAKLRFGAGIVPFIYQADQTGASTNGVNSTYQAQNATGVTSDGGSNVFQGGTGTSVYGKAAIFTGAIDFGAGDVSFPNSAVTLTAAQSTLTFYRLTAGGIAGNQNLTITRRAAAPGQVCIFNNTGFQITVFWLTGTGLAVANGATVWVGSDGTNAIKRG